MKFFYFLLTEKSFFYLTFSNEKDLLIYTGENEEGEVINQLTLPYTYRILLKKISEDFIEEKGILTNEKFIEIKNILNQRFGKTIDTTTFRFNYFSKELKAQFR